MVRYRVLLFEKTAGQSQAGKSARHMRWRPAIGASRVIGRFRDFLKPYGRITFNRKNLRIGQIVRILVEGKRPRLDEPPGFGILYVKARLKQSRQNSPEGLVYGNSNATTAFANSRLVVPALWVLAAKLTHWTLLTIFASSTITEDREQGFD